MNLYLKREVNLVHIVDTAHEFYMMIFAKITAVLCKITGKDNFFFAFLSLAIATALLLSVSFNTYLQGNNIFLQIFWTMLAFLFFVVPVYAALTEEKNVIDSSSAEVLQMSPLKNTVFLSVIWLTLPSVAIVYSIMTNNIRDVVGISFFLLIAIAIYFGHSTHPKGKSVLARAKERVQKAVSNIRLPQLLPKPIS